MKLQSSELPLAKPQPQPRIKRPSRLVPLVALAILLTVPLYYLAIRDYSSYNKLTETPPPVVLYLNPHDQPPPIIAPEEKPNIDDNTPVDAEEKTNIDDNTPIGDAEEKIMNDLVEDIDTSAVVGDASSSAVAVMQHPQRRGPRPARKKRGRSGRRKRAARRGGENKKQKVMMIRRNNTNDDDSLDKGLRCDLFSGEWVPNADGPYYTNETCGAIQEHQNCLKFGRPDREFLRWKWKPDGCEMPVFDPDRFLEMVRGKSVAFVGDSVARNHMQSLICLLSRVADPVDLSGPLDQNKRYEYQAHDFNISMFWAPYLVRTERTDPDDEKRPYNLYLDEFDENWTTRIALFDYVIISAGHWFFRPTYYYVDRRLAGCLYCPEANVTHYTTAYFSYRRAFRTAFRAINASGFGGVAFLRTFAPSHFEGAAWDRGGDCARTRPHGRNDVVLEEYSLEMYRIQLDELRIARRAARGNGGKLRLFDATKAMLLRPDGHPSKYGHLQGTNQSSANDCVHWCLPGPIDTWNDFLQELLSRDENSGDG